MSNLEINEEIIRQARLLYSTSTNFKIRQRMHFLLLKYKGYTHETIADILDVTIKSTFDWMALFREDHFDALATLNYKGQPSKLKEYGEQLVFEFIENPVATFKQAQQRIREVTGLDRSLPQVRHFLLTNKLIRRKVGQIPDKADMKAQETFKKNKLDRLLKLAQHFRVRLLFLDASHFVHLPFQGYLYSIKRIFIRAAAGRKRFNVLGALDAVNQSLTTICNESYINAQTVCQLLECIAKQYAGEKIYLVLDNARYQRCLFVQEMARALGIKLVFLPPYSPNLNLIERLWRFMKNDVLYNKFYADFLNFKKAIIGSIENIQTGKYEKELQSLLTFRFQLFEV